MKYSKEHGKNIPKFHLTHPMKRSDLFDINKRFIGGGMSQTYSALYFLEYYIQSFDFDYVVEIGSQKGALSLYLANIAAATESFYFETYEIDKNTSWYNRPEEGVGRWVEKLQTITPHIKSIEANIFNPTIIENIKLNIKNFDKCFIFCDGGNKIKEFNVFSPLLKSGDNIAVHDWGHEINENNIKECMIAHNIQMHHPFSEYCNELNNQIMPFVRG